MLRHTFLTDDVGVGRSTVGVVGRGDEAGRSLGTEGRDAVADLCGHPLAGPGAVPSESRLQHRAMLDRPIDSTASSESHKKIYK